MKTFTNFTESTFFFIFGFSFNVECVEVYFIFLLFKIGHVIYLIDKSTDVVC